MSGNAYVRLRKGAGVLLGNDRYTIIDEMKYRGMPPHAGHDRHTHAHHEPTNRFAETSTLKNLLACALQSLEYFLLVPEIFFEKFVIIA